MPLMQLKMLVLPAPLGPMMAKKSSALTSRVTPARAATPPKFRCNVSRVSSAIPPSLLAPRMLEHSEGGFAPLPNLPPGKQVAPAKPALESVEAVAHAFFRHDAGRRAGARCLA